MKKRALGYKSEEALDEGSTKAYNRYVKFLEKQVYGIAVRPPKFRRSKAIYKIANALSSLGSRILLYGNLHGGIVNTGTGFLEMWKEAVAGENYTTDEFWKAHNMYFQGLLRALLLHRKQTECSDGLK